MAQPQSAVAPMRLHLPKRALRRLQEAGIYCRTEVRLEHQHLAKRYVIHGTESGGAIRDIGRYVTFCGPEGEPIEQLHPVDSLGANGAHAVVVAPVLIKVDMFRYGRTYQLLISRHEPSPVANGTRPTLKSTRDLPRHGWLSSVGPVRQRQAPGGNRDARLLLAGRGKAGDPISLPRRGDGGCIVRLMPQLRAWSLPAATRRPPGYRGDNMSGTY